MAHLKWRWWSAANVHDREALPYLLHGQETRVWGYQGYQGQTVLIHQRAPNAKDFTNRCYRCHGRTNEVEKAKNRNRGLAKYPNRLEVTAALANLYIVRRRLLKA